MTCEDFKAEEAQLGKIEMNDKSSHQVESQMLTQIRSLFGDKAVLSFNNCKFEKAAVVYLAPKASELLAFSFILPVAAKSSTAMFDGTSFAKATGTSNNNKDFKMINDVGEELSAGIYFRKRTSHLWEYYILIQGKTVSNYDPDEPPDATVIISIGSLLFETDGALSAVRAWKPGESEPNEDNFFNRYLPTDFGKLKAGEYSYNTTESQFSIIWKSGALQSGLAIDFGQMPLSSIRVAESGEAFQYSGMAQDGRKKIE